MNHRFISLILVSLFFAVPAPLLAGASVQVSSDSPARVYVGGELVGETPLTLQNLRSGSHDVRLEDIRTGEVKTYRIHSPRNVDVLRSLEARFGSAGVAGAGTCEPAVIGRTTLAPRRSTVIRPFQTAPLAYGGIPSAYVQQSTYPSGPLLGYRGGGSIHSYRSPVGDCIPGTATGVPLVRSGYDRVSTAYYSPGAYPVTVSTGNSYRSRSYRSGSRRYQNALLGVGLVNEVFNNGRSRKDIRKAVVGAGLLNALVGR